MKTERDPYTQAQLIIKLREGNSLEDACELTGCRLSHIRNTMTENVEFGQQVADAQFSKFEPVYRHALELAEDADSEGENQGSLTAMALVFKHNQSKLDRRVMLRAAEIKAAGLSPVGPAPQPALSPAAVADYAEQLKHRMLTEADGVEVLEDSDDEEGPQPL